MATPLLPYELLAGLPQQWLLVLSLLLPVVLLVSSYLFLASPGTKKMTKNGSLRLPPGPGQVPVLGNLHLLLGPLPHRNLLDLARRHGPVMLLRLGTVPTLVISSAAAAREVMKEHDIDCCSRPVSPGPKRISYGLKDVIFAPYGEQCCEMRKLFIVELLSMRRVQAAWYAREQQVDRLIANLSRAGAAAAPVALNEHIFRLVDGIFGTVAFGNIYGSERFAHREFQHVMDDAMDLMASFSAEDFFPNTAGQLIDRITGLAARRERIFRELDAFFETVLDHHTDPARLVPEKGGDLVDVLVSLWKEDRGPIGFSRDHVKGFIMDTFTGGIDTSSVTMLWAMSELIRKSQVLRKAQDEVRAVAGGKARVEPDDVPKLPYLKMVVKETLRLHPPATLLVPRETVRDVRIGGYDVPARTRAGVGERVGDRQGSGELGKSRGVRPGQVRGQRRRLLRRTLRAGAVRGRAADLPRTGHGRDQRDLHAGEPALLLRLGAAGGDGGGGRQHGGDRRADVPPEDAAGVGAHKVQRPPHGRRRRRWLNKTRVRIPKCVFI